MRTWLFTLRGIRYRPGRSLVVVILAAIATAAAVVIPTYSRAASQSVLLDAVRSVPAGLSGVTASTRAGAGTAPPSLTDTRAVVAAAIAAQPVLARHLAQPIGFVSIAAVVGDTGAADTTAAQARLVYREGACDHLRIVAGVCARARGEAMVGARVADAIHAPVGASLRLTPTSQFVVAEPVSFTVVGLYEPIDPGGAYWGHAVSFPRSAVSDALDPVLAGSDLDVTRAGVPTRAIVEFPLRDPVLRIDEQAQLSAEVNAVSLVAGQQQLSVVSSLPFTITVAAVQQGSVAASFPLVALPLVALCWLVLFLVVASLTEERSPEIAAGKLRGMRLAQVSGFGVREPLVLVAIGAVAGVGLGLVASEFATRAFLAEGVRIELRASVLAWAAAALVGAVAAAALAVRGTVTADVATLMRRVPARSRRRLAVVEGAVAAGALLAVGQVVLGGDRASALAYLAPPLLALLAGLLAARVVGGGARLWVLAARAKGRLAPMLSAAQVARRPGAARVVAVLTIAVALLSFAVSIWDVAATNRVVAAEASLGADRVYTVNASSAAALLDGVRRADPGGAHAMAVVHTDQFYLGRLDLLAVDSSRLAAVARWPGQSRAQAADIVRRLHTPLIAPPKLHGPEIQLDATVAELQQARPTALALLLAHPGGAAWKVSLGPLVAGEHTYRASDNRCVDACDLVGLVLTRFPADFEPASITLMVRSVRDRTGTVDAQLTGGRWRVPADLPQGDIVRVATAADGLSMTAKATANADVVVEFGAGAGVAPAAASGVIGNGDTLAGEVSLPTVGSAPQPLALAAHLDAIPGGGARGLLFDLETALAHAGRRGTVDDLAGERYEVWCNAGAGPDFGSVLKAAGLEVIDLVTIEDRLAVLGRQAPALALRLYLMAGATALLLALGVVLLSAFVGASGRLYDLAALRVAGVPRRILRQAVRREFLLVLGVPLLVGVGAGVGAAWLLLPSIPLVSAGEEVLAPVYRFDGLWLPGATAALLGCFVLVAAAMVSLVNRAQPDRLREGAR